MTFTGLACQNSLGLTMVRQTVRNFFWIVVVLSVFSCGQEDATFKGRQITYPLSAANTDYLYEGTAIFKELEMGGVEVTLQLAGDRGEGAYYFPVHLHYGEYDMPEAPMAAMLNPVDIRTLKSVTIVDKLSSGEAFNFDDLGNFDGHIKVHLADDGPDYHVILVAGNIGKNRKTEVVVMDQVSLCRPF